MYQLAEIPEFWKQKANRWKLYEHVCYLYNTICFMYRKNMLAITVTLAFIRLGILAMIPTLLLYFLAFTELKNLL